MPLKDQLRDLLSSPHFYKLRRGCAKFCAFLDVNSEKAYRMLYDNVIDNYTGLQKKVVCICGLSILFLCIFRR